MHGHPPDQALVERIIARHIRHPRADQVIQFPGHAVNRQDFRHVTGGTGKGFQPRWFMAVSAHLHEHHQPQPQRARVQ
jgi:hypothetical protein